MHAAACTRAVVHVQCAVVAVVVSAGGDEGAATVETRVQSDLTLTLTLILTLTWRGRTHRGTSVDGRRGCSVARGVQQAEAPTQTSAFPDHSRTTPLHSS